MVVVDVVDQVVIVIVVQVDIANTAIIATAATATDAVVARSDVIRRSCAAAVVVETVRPLLAPVDIALQPEIGLFPVLPMGVCLQGRDKRSVK